jgi:hypothetical protein
MARTSMKRFQIYRNGAFDEDSLVILDFATVPEDGLPAAEHEAFEMSLSGAVGERETIEDVYQNYPQLCGFEPWIWKASGGWNPQGLNREWLMKGEKLAAKAEFKEYLRTFIDTYHRYVSPDEIRDVLEQELADRADRSIDE